MRGWAKKWWLVCVLTGAAILILGWGVRCERQVAKCRADYAAQESRTYGFSVNGNAAEQEVINAACEPSGYLCRLFSSANFPTWLLVFVGIGGVWAAMKTLSTIQMQTDAIVRDADATQAAAIATQTSVELQKAAMEQWVDTDDWESSRIYIQPAATEADLRISFRLVNPTKFPLTLRSVELWVNQRKNRLVVFRKLIVPPDDGTRVEISFQIKGQNIANYRTNSLTLEIGGLIKFVDMFKKDQERLFGITCTCGPNTSGEFDSTAFTPPSENEEHKQPQNPN